MPWLTPSQGELREEEAEVYLTLTFLSLLKKTKSLLCPGVLCRAPLAAVSLALPGTLFLRLLGHLFLSSSSVPLHGPSQQPSGHRR